MKYFYKVAAFLLILFSHELSAEIGFYNYETLVWKGKSYTSEAPKPFGNFEVNAEYDSKGCIRKFMLVFEANRIDMTSLVKERMSRVNKVEVAYDKDAFSNAGLLEKLIIILESDEEEVITLDQSIGCEKNCSLKQNKLFAFEITPSGEVNEIALR